MYIYFENLTFWNIYVSNCFMIEGIFTSSAILQLFTETSNLQMFSLMMSLLCMFLIVVWLL